MRRQKKHYPRQQALMAGSPIYFGKRCDKHPELEGMRATHNYGCPVCTQRFMAERLRLANLAMQRNEEAFTAALAVIEETDELEWVT